MMSGAFPRSQLEGTRLGSRMPPAGRQGPQQVRAALWQITAHRGKHPLWQWSLELVENAGPLLTGWACDNLQGTLKLATVGLLRIRKRKSPSVGRGNSLSSLSAETSFGGGFLCKGTCFNRITFEAGRKVAS